MNPTLAAMYNTNGFAAVAHREQVKVAHLELFAKAAAAQGIDLTSLDQATANSLYAEFTQKLAEEGAEVPADESPAHEEGESTEEEKEEQEEGDDDEDKGESSEGESSEGSEEEKKEAQAQFRTMQEWQQKVAEADYLGRVMAHAFHNEDSQIKQASGEIVRHAGDALATLGGKKKGLSTAAKAGLAAGGAALAAGGAYAAHRAMKKKDEGSKEASAFDVQAARHALKIASQAKLNTKEAAARLNALLTLGVPEMNKTASALGNYDQALNVRALELLEAGGYPINWDQVFGG